jgi:hypothetical protein
VVCDASMRAAPFGLFHMCSALSCCFVRWVPHECLWLIAPSGGTMTVRFRLAQNSLMLAGRITGTACQ